MAEYISETTIADALDVAYQPQHMLAEVHLSGVDVVVELVDGRRVMMPLAWHNWLQTLTAEQRANYQMRRRSVYWPDVDDGFSIEPVILGLPLPEYRTQVIRDVMDVVRRPVNHFTAAQVTDDGVTVTLADGRTVFMPLAWFPWLQAATPDQRAAFTLEPTQLTWPALSESIGVATAIIGRPTRD